MVSEVPRIPEWLGSVQCGPHVSFYIFFPKHTIPLLHVFDP